MSALKTYFAGGALVAVVSAIPGLFIPADKPPLPLAPITVHRLAMDWEAFTVIQDRTVESHGGDVVPMEWNARIEAFNGEPVRDCAGSGRWDYEAGYLDARLPGGQWVGHPRDCTASDLLPGVTYQLVASWWTVDGHSIPVTARSEPFTVPEE